MEDYTKQPWRLFDGQNDAAKVHGYTLKAHVTNPDQVLNRRPLSRQNSNGEKSRGTHISEIDSHYHEDFDENAGHPTPVSLIPGSFFVNSTVDDEELTIASLEGHYRSDGDSIANYSKKSLALSEVDSQIFEVVSRKSLAISEVDSSKGGMSGKSDGKLAGEKRPFYFFIPKIFTTAESEDGPAQSPANASSLSHADMVTGRTANANDLMLYHRPPADHTVTLGKLSTTSSAQSQDQKREPTKMRAAVPFIRPVTANQATLEDNIQSGGDSTAETASTSWNEAALHAWQARCLQAEERARALTDRLLDEERLHRQVSVKLREENWERSQLEREIQELQNLVLDMEHEKQDIDAHIGTKLAAVAKVETKSYHPGDQSDRDHAIQMARVTSGQETARKQLKDMIRDLKRAQDRILALEASKVSVVKELAELEETEKLRQEAHAEQLQEMQEQLDAKVSSLTAEILCVSAEKAKLMAQVEAANSLHSQAIKSQNEVKESLAQALEREQTAKTQLDLMEAEKTSLQSKLESTSIDMTSMAEQFAMARDAAAELQRQLLASEQETKKQKYQVEAYESERSELESRLEIATITASDLDVKLKSLENELQRTLSDKDKLLSEIESVKALHAEEVLSKAVLQDSLTEALERAKGMESMLAKMEVEKASLQTDLDVTASSLSEMDRKLIEARDAYLEIEKQLRILEDEVRDLQSQIQSHCADRNSLEDRLQEATKRSSDLDAKVEDLESQMQNKAGNISKLVDELESSKGLHATLLESTNKLKGALSEAEGRENMLRSILDVLEKEKSSLEAELASSASDLSSMAKELTATRSTVADLETRLEQSEKEAKQLITKIEEVHLEKTNLEVRLEMATMEANDYKAKVLLLESDGQASTAEKAKLLKEVDDAKVLYSMGVEEKERMQEVLLKSTQREEDLIAMLAEVKTEKVSLESELAESSSKLATLANELTAARDMVVDLEARFHSSEDDVKQLSSQILASGQEKSELEDKLKKVEAESCVVVSMLATLEIQVQRLSSEKAELLHVIDATRSTLAQEIETKDALQASLTEAVKREEEAKSSLDAMEELKVSLESKLESSTVELALMAKQLSSSLDRAKDLELRLQRSDDEVKELLSRIETVDSEKNEMEVKFTVATENASVLESQLSLLEKEVQRTTAEKENLLVQLETAESRLSREMESKVLLQESLTAALSREEEAKTKLSMIEAEKVSLESEVKKLTIQISSMETELIEVRAVAEDLKTRLQESADQASNLKATVEETRGERSWLKRSLQQTTTKAGILETQVSSLEAEVNRLNDENSKLSKEIETFGTQYAEKTQTLMSTSNEFEKKYLSLKRDFSFLQNEMQLVMKARDETEQKLYDANLNIAKIEMHLDATTNQLGVSEAEREESLSKLVVIVNEMEALRSTNNTLQERLASVSRDLLLLREENKSLAQEHELSLQEHNKALRDVETRAAQDKSLYDASLKEKTSLEDTVQTLKSNLMAVEEKLKNDLRAVEQSREEVERDLSEARTRMSELETDLEAAQQQIKDSQMNQADLLEKVQYLESEARNVKSEKSELEARFDLLGQERLGLIAKISALEDELARTRITEKDLKQDLELTHCKVESLLVEVKALHEDGEKAKVTYEENNRGIQELADEAAQKLETVSVEKEVLARQVQSLLSEKSESDRFLQDSLKRTEAIEKQLDDLRRKGADKLASIPEDDSSYSVSNLENNKAVNRELQSIPADGVLIKDLEIQLKRAREETESIKIAAKKLVTKIHQMERFSPDNSHHLGEDELSLVRRQLAEAQDENLHLRKETGYLVDELHRLRKAHDVWFLIAAKTTMEEVFSC